MKASRAIPWSARRRRKKPSKCLSLEGFEIAGTWPTTRFPTGLPLSQVFLYQRKLKMPHYLFRHLCQ